MWNSIYCRFGSLQLPPFTRTLYKTLQLLGSSWGFVSWKVKLPVFRLKHRTLLYFNILTLGCSESNVFNVLSVIHHATLCLPTQARNEHEAMTHHTVTHLYNLSNTKNIHKELKNEIIGKNQLDWNRRKCLY